MVWKECGGPGVSLGERGEPAGRDALTASVLLGLKASSDTEYYFPSPLGRLELEEGNPKSIKENFP